MASNSPLFQIHSPCAFSISYPRINLSQTLDIAQNWHMNDLLSPHWVLKDLSRLQSSLYVRSSFCPSICMVIYVAFGDYFLARIFAQRMRMQATGSNPLSSSIICSSIHPVFRNHFANFCICIHFQCGDTASKCIYLYCKSTNRHLNDILFLS